MIDLFTIIAWIVLAILFLGVVAAVVYLGSLPGNIARKRNHPQADAINAASWIGLALMGAGWPIAFVWAFLRQAPAGSQTEGTNSAEQPSSKDIHDELVRLSERLAAIESQLASTDNGEEG